MALGDLWSRQGGPAFAEALKLPGVRLHLYGKREARPGRKMGHLSSIGATSQEALSRVLESYRRLSPDTITSFDVHEPVLSFPTL